MRLSEDSDDSLSWDGKVKIEHKQAYIPNIGKVYTKQMQRGAPVE